MSHRHDAGTAGRAGIRASTATGYRMPPLHARPALGDCLAVYRHALTGHPPGKIIAGGVPVGGNLAAALVPRAEDEGCRCPRRPPGLRLAPAGAFVSLPLAGGDGASVAF
jgi:acetyl esterase/lipase